MLFKRKPKKEKHMDYFSDEFRNKLIAEHKLIAASIARIETEQHIYAQRHHLSSIANAISNLKARKIELEAQIDVLEDYLHG
jgi:citrate synthase